MVVLIAQTLFSVRSFGCDEDNFGVKDAAMVVLIAQAPFLARSFGCDEDNLGCSCHPHIYVHSRGL